MTLETVEVKTYQSLHHVEVLLGKLTVIVGASSSGKSAFMRACRTLVRNASGASFVTQGKKSAAIRFAFDSGSVSLERGSALSIYRTHLSGAQEAQYPKSGTQVPDEVSDVLRMPKTEGIDLNFAFQFDRPFLLDEPGSTVAKVLGDLTNVNLLHEAAREANRRRLEASSRLKVRKQDVVDAAEVLRRYTHLPQAKAALERAGEVDVQRQSAADHAARLKGWLQQYATASAVVEEADRRAQSVPDVEAALAEAERWLKQAAALRQLVVEYANATRNAQLADEAADRAQDEAEEADIERVEYLAKLGVCPVCEQKTGHLMEATP